jgi:ankyrin repeat protein
LDGFFLPIKQEYVDAWTGDLVRTIRSQDLAALQQLHQSGERLQACNAFGESIVHLSVRRGTPEMLNFLVQDVGISVRVCCDYGRTPLHDAAWGIATNPHAYDMMEVLLQECPMQLFIVDKRGYTPLNYVPRDRWTECCAFLDRIVAEGKLKQFMK